MKIQHNLASAIENPQSITIAYINQCELVPKSAQMLGANNAVQLTVRLMQANGTPPSFDYAYSFDSKIDRIFVLTALHTSKAWRCRIFTKCSLSATAL